MIHDVKISKDDSGKDDFNPRFSGGLPPDPRTWGREDVGQFLQYCEKEFDLEKIDMEKFQMNGENLIIRYIYITRL